MAQPNAINALLAGSNELFSLPDIYFQLNQMVKDSRFSVTDIGKVIAKDPGLSARLLRLVNSSFYGFQAKIDTISRAITIIGLEELYNLIVATCVVDQFEKIPNDLVDMTSFWMHSVHCGVVARLLAKQTMILHSERLFLSGLLHDIGSLLLYQKMPDECRKILLASGQDRRLLADYEMEIIGFTHADVSRALIKSWHLPDSLSEPIGCYLNPDQAKMYSMDAYLLNIATGVVDQCERGTPSEHVADQFSAHILEQAHLDREQVGLVTEQASIEFLSVFELLDPNKHFS